MGKKKLGKVSLSVSVDPGLLEWIDEQVEKKTYASRTHAFEAGATRLKLIDDIRLGRKTHREAYIVVEDAQGKVKPARVVVKD